MKRITSLWILRSHKYHQDLLLGQLWSNLITPSSLLQATLDSVSLSKTLKERSRIRFKTWTFRRSQKWLDVINFAGNTNSLRIAEPLPSSSTASSPIYAFTKCYQSVLERSSMTRRSSHVQSSLTGLRHQSNSKSNWMQQRKPLTSLLATGPITVWESDVLAKTQRRWPRTHWQHSHKLSPIRLSTMILLLTRLCR